ncbi:hypothetical protein GGH92_000031 [Coemansia sp. RSA 2673]|nr:hypothetical protein GGH92_000031 [Coemansia sp. RSA 2673]
MVMLLKALYCARPFTSDLSFAIPFVPFPTPCLLLVMRVSFSVLSLSFAALAFAASDDDPSCPPECNGNASDSKRYDSSNDFAACNRTVFFNYENFYDPNSQAVIACTKKDDLPSVKTTNLKAGPVLFTAPSRCMTATNYPKNLNHGWWGDNKPEFRDGAVAVGNMLRNYMSDFNHCQEMSTFASQGNTFGAVWAGGMPNAKYFQWCDDKDPAKTAGIIIDASGNKEAVRQAMQQWSMGKCWDAKTGSATWNNKDLWFFDYNDRKNGYVTPDPGMGSCNYKTVASGDNMAAKCGVTGDALQIFNPGVDFSKLQVGQPVCCSAGKLPDLRPPMNPDGSCRVHTVVTGQSCETIKAMYYPLGDSDLTTFNKDTYGWMGCGNGYPWANTKICVSPGTSPRPTPNPLAECGPLAAGDKYKTECPLKACCSSDGFCGLAGKHCEKTSSPTGAPGTTGCETNCDIGYVKGSPPSSFIKVGYYESWSVGWKCMNGGFSAVDWSKYTHVHFSFADIGLDLQVKMDAMATSEFVSFKKLAGPKKIVSFGGWGISTDVGTYQHLRNAMLPANIDTVVTNLVNWMNANQLDGLDIDWEYPGAPDIPGIPAGLPSDAPNYLTFLKKLKAKMPAGKSLSIAAPASYWYLKQFPITDMAQQLDYIVYMTYDLHGQWDYGNQWTGNWLKSHVNWTETQQALNLITHAGVPSNKVLLGLGAYGRSFQQVDPNCSGPNCKFTGPNSGASPGVCTNANGYISLAEINKIIKDGGTRRQYYDQASDSDVLLYGKDQWVAWSSENSMRIRENWARDNNMGGTVLWAADLVKSGSAESVKLVDVGCKLGDITFSGDIDYKLCSQAQVAAAIGKWKEDLVSYYKNKLSGNVEKIISLYLPGNSVSQVIASKLDMVVRKIQVMIPQSNNSLNKRAVDLAFIPTLYDMSSSLMYMSTILGDLSSGLLTGKAALAAAGALIMYMLPNFNLSDVWDAGECPAHNYDYNHVDVCKFVNDLISSNGVGFEIWNYNDVKQVDDYLNFMEDIGWVDDGDTRETLSSSLTELCPVGGRSMSSSLFNATMKINFQRISDLWTGLGSSVPRCLSDLPRIRQVLQTPANPALPTYYVNADGFSPGVAANWARYILRTGDRIMRYPGFGNRFKPLRTASNGAISRYRSSRINVGVTDSRGLIQNFQRDEVPFASVENGYIPGGRVEAQIMLVEARDNRADGNNLNSFYRGTNQFLAPGIEHPTDWSLLNPALPLNNNPDSPDYNPTRESLGMMQEYVRVMRDGRERTYVAMRRNQLYNVVIARLPLDIRTYAMLPNLTPRGSEPNLQINPDALRIDITSGLTTPECEEGSPMAVVGGSGHGSWVDPHDVANWAQIYGTPD